MTGTSATRADVVVVGGGLAGITAALRLADSGRRVTLLESRPRLGGAAFSFHRAGLSVDNGQHVFLRCCTAYQWLLGRLGASDRVTLQDKLDIPVLRPDGATARLRRTKGVPAPGHLTAALAGYGLLSPADRVRAVRGALAMRFLDPDDPTLDSTTLGEFLRRHGQNDATIEALWSIVVVATLNLQVDEASLALAAKVFRTGLLDHAPASDIGFAGVPLGDLHSVAAHAALLAAGVDVRLAHRVTTVEQDGSDWVVNPGDPAVDSIRAYTVIAAVPSHQIRGLVPGLAAHPAWRGGELGTAPIVNIHVVYDRPVTDLAFGAGVGSSVQWFFDRTESSGLHSSGIAPSGQYLAVTVSAADDLIDRPSREVLDLVVPDLADLLPRAYRAEVVDAFVTRERRATFRQSAGSAALRPGTDSGLPGLWLAGSWTATGWPDTMESAVLSGLTAASAVVARGPSGRTDFTDAVLTRDYWAA